MFDLLTKEEDAAALSQGWELLPVYDLAATRWCVAPLPYAAGELIVNHARTGSAFHIKALRLIQAGYERKTK